MRLSPVVFAVLLSLPSLAPAQEKPAEPKPPPRESLRYDGKPFEYWQTYWQTELKAERRVECLRAMGAFGSNGYGAEAAAVIVGMARTYSADAFRCESDNLRNAFHQSIKYLGAPGAHALLANLNHPNVRRLARDLLAQPGALAIPSDEIPTLVQMAMSAKEDERDLALDVIHFQVLGQKQISAALANELAKRNTEEAFLKVVFRNLRGPSNTGGIFQAPVTTITAVGATTVGGSYSPGYGGPSSEDLLDKLGRHAPSLKRIAYQLAIAELRELKKARNDEVEQEKEKFTAGTGIYMTWEVHLPTFYSSARCSSIVVAKILGKMGPAARAALPELREALEDPCVELQNAARTAIEQIAKK